MPLFRKRNDPPPASVPERPLPPHMQRIVEERSRPLTEGDAPSRDIERRRLALQYDIDQGELALAPDNPWTHRIELLTEALAQVEAELQLARTVSPSPFSPVPETPITDTHVSASEPYSVSFTIGDEHFAWQEKLDWEERGGILAQPELEQTSGNAGALVPDATPPDLRTPLADHLRDSIFTFATTLRDARLDGDMLPEGRTLADLARPCPTCGGWTDANGHCNACAIRRGNEQQLFHERQRLMSERAAEAEERHRLSERLPLARRRMAELEREIAERPRES